MPRPGAQVDPFGEKQNLIFRFTWAIRNCHCDGIVRILRDGGMPELPCWIVSECYIRWSGARRTLPLNTLP